MSNLILDSLEIRNFRGLKELKIEKLGRVNLLVGKNNSGKTSVLEALRIYSQPASLKVLVEIFEERNEFDRVSAQSPGAYDSPGPLPIESLFSGRVCDFSNDHNGSMIQIGPCGQLGLLVQPKRIGTLKGPRSEIRALVFDFHEESKYIDTLWYDIEDPEYWNSQFPESKRTKCVFRNATMIGEIRSTELWDAVSLSDAAEEVPALLRSLSPEIERLAFRPISDGSPRRVPHVRIKGTPSPVPLRSLGDGVNRVLEIALCLVSAEKGLLLIDEFENGLHYSIQPQIWKFVFDFAKKLNVQVFATTHSFDCIQAFQEAAKASPGEDGKLIRIGQRAGRTLVAEFDERDMEIVVDGQIEVR